MAHIHLTPYIVILDAKIYHGGHLLRRCGRRGGGGGGTLGGWHPEINTATAPKASVKKKSICSL